MSAAKNLRSEGNGACPSHFVQFYRSDRFLAISLSEYVRIGLENNEGVVIVATKIHQKMLREELASVVPNFENYIFSRQLVLMKAEQTLENIMTDGEPDFIKFQDTIGGVFEYMEAHFSGMRFFGELVDILCQRDEIKKALTLESYRNTILKSKHNVPVLLLCGYNFRNLKNEYGSCEFEPICCAHSEVIPAEFVVEEETSEAVFRKLAVLEMRSALLAIQSKERARLLDEIDEMRAVLVKSQRWE
jgi:hypothetical protein